MAAIEKITASKIYIYTRVPGTAPVQFQRHEVEVWNATIANLTLMALGSSAPEILLSVLEVIQNQFYTGELGPSTIVGSAAFNLMCISAVCVTAIAEDDSRVIVGTKVY